jgi:hypothetical protein
MLAVLGLLGAAALTGHGNPFAADPDDGSEADRDRFANANATSDDPMLNFDAWPNAIKLRNAGADRTHHRDIQGLWAAVHDVKEQQGGFAGGPLRLPELEPDEYAALNRMRWEGYNSDLMFQGNNNSTDNYHIRWARGLPRDPDPGCAELGRSDATFADTCGTVAPIDSWMGPTQEGRFFYTQGSNEYRTGICHDLQGHPHWPHMF